MTVRGGTFGAGETPTLYSDCRFDGSTLRRIHSGEARFERCTFLDCDIRKMNNLNGEFIDCVFGGRLEEVTFRANPWTPDGSPHPRRDKNIIDNNDFRGADMHWVGFVGGIDLARQNLPTGPEYLLILDFEEKIPAAQQLLDEASPAEKKALRAALSRLEDIANRNNDQIFARLDDICNGDKVLTLRLAEALK